MSIEHIKTSLEKLRHINVDHDVRVLLEELDNNIQQLSISSSTTLPHPSTFHEKVVELAQRISAEMAVKHPHLEPVLREILDTLTNMGI